MLNSNTGTLSVTDRMVRLRIEAAEAHSRYYAIFEPQISQTQISTDSHVLYHLIKLYLI